MPAYITETFGLSTSLSILTTAVLPIFSIFSITIASWLLQKLHNELFTAGILFVIGTLSSLLLLPFYQSLPVFSITMMTLITGCIICCSSAGFPGILPDSAGLLPYPAY